MILITPVCVFLSNRIMMIWNTLWYLSHLYVFFSNRIYDGVEYLMIPITPVCVFLFQQNYDDMEYLMIPVTPACVFLSNRIMMVWSTSWYLSNLHHWKNSWSRAKTNDTWSEDLQDWEMVSCLPGTTCIVSKVNCIPWSWCMVNTWEQAVWHVTEYRLIPHYFFFSSVFRCWDNCVWIFSSTFEFVCVFSVPDFFARVISFSLVSLLYVVC